MTNERTRGRDEDGELERCLNCGRLYTYVEGPELRCSYKQHTVISISGWCSSYKSRTGMELPDCSMADAHDWVLWGMQPFY